MPKRPVLLLLLAVAAALVLTPAAGARAPDRLEVLRALAVPDRGVLVLDVRCRGRCTGRLVVTTEVNGDATFGRRVRLRTGRRVRLELRLRRDGLAKFELEDEVFGSLELRAPGRQDAWTRFSFDLRMSCRSGTTVAATKRVRVLELRPWGTYVCARPAGRPIFVTPDRVHHVRVAGRFAAVADYGAWKCGGAQVLLVDVRAGRIVRRRSSSSVYDSLANGCHGTEPVGALVLTPTGAIAWTELPGDDARAHVRAVDADGTDRVLENAPGVDVRSLTLAPDDRTIAWTGDGGRRQETLR